MVREGNNQQLDGFQSIGIQLKDDELDTLELFAQAETLTMMQINNVLKSTKLERTYKNVYKKVHQLKEMKLIENIPVVGRVRNNEKPLKLTNDGIYQLFLKRPYGVLLDQLSIRKGKPHVSYVSHFLRCYGNNLVFRLFLHPYFEDQTISIENFGLLLKLFRYVSECCRSLEAATLGQSILLFIPKFSWNKVPGEDDEKLLESLKKIGALRHEPEIQIQKSSDNNTISLVTPHNIVTVKLDTTVHKAFVWIGNSATYEYKITVLGPEITVGTTHQSEDPIKSTSERVRKLLEPHIFEIVSNLTEDEIRVLARDTKFMLLLEDINIKFGSGYKRLMELRKIS